MPEPQSNDERPGHGPYLSRRELLGVGGAMLLGGGIATSLRAWRRHERGLRADVLIARAEDYGAEGDC